ncbi:helix-turn-helix domain-containing protein [Rubrivivax gelatinosus]|uniref:helix-turn-helix domain-containing protein n=1 Tax=Rubrivivax gelatinosus TaxID=28068 RepID=UPI00104808FF|nr:helix-turn-helix transcriptional regulator [Rubrivivax gelatinosus]MBK1686218.1 hypothetical protein [Rubrivivax gelatinosus]
MSDLADRLREERARLGLTQTEFGALGQVSKDAQLRYERGDRVPDAAYLAAVAGHGVDVLYVVTGVRSATFSDRLSSEQVSLLEHYAAATDEGKAAVRYVLTALAQVAKR